MVDALTFAGADDAPLAAELWAPAGGDADPVPGVVLAHDLGGPAEVRGVAAALARAGLACLVPDLWSREGGPPELAPGAGDAARWQAEVALPDRRALEDLDRAVRYLAADERVLDDGVGCVGLGMGGTLAFLLGCTSRDVAAVAAVGGRVLYPELSAAKPTQPLELLLNLDRPLLALAAEGDPALPPEHLALWREKLDAGGKDHELVVYPGALPALEEDEVLARVVAFLVERL